MPKSSERSAEPSRREFVQDQQVELQVRRQPEGADVVGSQFIVTSTADMAEWAPASGQISNVE